MLELKRGAWQFQTLTRFVTRVFPLVEEELKRWKKYLESCPPGELKNQALASIRDKRFHCQGGSIFLLYNSSSFPEKNLVSLIVALQTISDYLDNLCDRVQVQEERAFRRLHRAMTDALDPSRDPSPSYYYEYYTHQEDGGYLKALVRTCQEEVQRLPSFSQVQGPCLELVTLYGDLQVYKHLSLAVREEKLKGWFEKYRPQYPYIYWWEFAAAAGSTLGVFMLLAAGGEEGLKEGEIKGLMKAYFPWICGLHILLDYFIDQQEDRVHRDLNFVSYYRGEDQCLERFKYFLDNSLSKAGELLRPHFHRLVVKGLLAMYLSDPKVEKQGLSPLGAELLKRAGPDSRGMYSLCRGLRQLGRL